MQTIPSRIPSSPYALVCAENFYATRMLAGRMPAEWAAIRFGRLPLSQIPQGVAADPADAIRVRVDYGKWVVECPDCCAAQAAARTDHRFLCHECYNTAIGGLWRPVIWPPHADEIEVALLRIRDRHQRNWRPEDG